MLRGLAAPGGSEATARIAPRRSISARMRRPDGLDAVAGGISITACPPGRR